MAEPERAGLSLQKISAIALGIVLFFVILFGPEPDPENPAVGRTMAVAVMMAVFWLTEAIPIAITAMIPVVAFPFLGVMSGGDVAPLYINNIIFLFIGGFLLALSMERWGLHRRIALKIVLTIGRNPTWLLFGFMAASWVLSQWVSNTATTLMMTPIVMALAAKFEEGGGADARALTVCMLLGVAYASSVGGMATLIGTAPNLSFAKIFALSFPNAPEITFLGWMAFALPVSFVLFTIIFAYLRFVHLRHTHVDFDRDILEREYNALGPMSFEEKSVAWVFASFVLLIIARGDVTVGQTVLHGWASRLGVGGFVSDGTVSVTVALVLYMIPARSRAGAVLDADAIGRLPWDIIVLLGGGFALAKAFQVSGLSQFLGEQLAVLEAVHPFLLVLSICALITFLTELTSNTATTQVVLPVIASLSTVIGVNPMLLMIPATITASCAFMLPVATPPNAIVFGTHRLRIRDMARTGVALNFIGIFTVAILMFLLGAWIFDIHVGTPPAWME